MQQPTDPQAQHHYRVLWEHLRLPLRVKTGREHLQQRRDSVVELLRNRIDVTCWYGEEVGKGAIAVATHQLRPAAHVFLPPEALVAGSAKHVGVDHDPSSGGKLRCRALKGTDHLVSEDQGIVDGDLAAEDADIGTADTSGADAYHNVLSTDRRLGATHEAEALR